MDMRTIGLLLLTIFLLPTLAIAQDQQPAPAPETPSRVNAFIGYSFYSTSLSSVGRASTYGWEASIDTHLYRWFSIVGDVDTHYGKQGFQVCQTFPTSGAVCTTITADFIERNFLVGPRASFKAGAFRPFVEVLAGGAHVNAGDIVRSDNSWAGAVGGGTDYTFTRHFGWRLQADYLRTQFFRNTENNVQPSSGTQNNIRVSTGLVYNF
jgi:hypothetical protein